MVRITSNILTWHIVAKGIMPLATIITISHDILDLDTDLNASKRWELGFPRPTKVNTFGGKYASRPGANERAEQ